MTDLMALRAPFPPDRISWRVGSTTADKKRGMALAYIDARDVMERLDEICGPAGWQCRYPHANGKTVCEIGVKIGDEWIWKADGAGDTDVEKEKGALSDAFKRSAVRWGIGRYLYDLDSPWVLLEPMGRSFKIADAEMPKLHALLRKSGAPAPAPAPRQAPASVATAAQQAIKPDNSITDWGLVADDMIADAMKLRTVYDVNALLTERKDQFNKMPKNIQDKVKAAVGKHRESLAAMVG